MRQISRGREEKSGIDQEAVKKEKGGLHRMSG